MAKSKANRDGKPATHEVSGVIEKEREYLEIKETDKVSGLAVSGGGIRSASFGLGVMQALVANNQLEKMDYMSTVSGGGYLGSALTWALKQGGKNAGTKPDNFPLGKRGMFAGQDKDCKMDNPNLHNNGLLDFIRQHSSYLLPTSGLGVVSFAGVVIRSILLSLSVYFGILLILMILMKTFPLFHCQFTVLSFDFKGIFIFGAILLVLIFLFINLIYSLTTFFNENKVGEYKFFIYGQKATGVILTWAMIFLLVGSVPYVASLLETTVEKFVWPTASTLFGTLVGIRQYIKAQNNDNSRGPVSDIMIYLATFALIYGLLLLAFLGANKFFFLHGSDNSWWMPHWGYFFALVAATLIFGYFVNLNLVGPHRIWRDRLMEAFMPDKDAVEHNQWEPAKKADSAMMEDMCDQHNKRPYHIINTNIILANSTQVKFRGRGGDNFIISPFYCGSEATGWKLTKDFQKQGGRGITLATAMATSAAALNPDAGVSGAGITRNVIVSTLLSILNLRLGYWTGNPDKNAAPSRPNFFVPGLKTEIMRLGFAETSTRILLSDGGHFENLALYELIRRKLDLIVISDGGADGTFNFDDLANAVEKVRVDFGAKIVFRDGKDSPASPEAPGEEFYGLNDILFDADGRNAFQKKYDIAKRGFAIADIFYNDHTTEKPSKGKLVYLKLAMIDDLSTDVYSYKGLNPTFPHQSTADQFFDEKQFEAYRELGYTVAWKMMESKEGLALFPPKPKPANS